MLTRPIDAASGDGLRELSFSRGDILDIVDDSGGWWQARKADGVYGSEPIRFQNLSHNNGLPIACSLT
jgi:SHO1 osmosensor